MGWPIARPEAFTKETLADAQDTWQKKFLKGGRIPPEFSCVQAGPETGLVKMAGSAIFADYDLMAISRSNSRGDMLFTKQCSREGTLLQG